LGDTCTAFRKTKYPHRKIPCTGLYIMEATKLTINGVIYANYLIVKEHMYLKLEKVDLPHTQEYEDFIIQIIQMRENKQLKTVSYLYSVRA